MFKASKGSRTTVTQWIKNFHIDVIIIKNIQTETVALKSIVIKNKSLDELDRRFKMAEESVNLNIGQENLYTLKEQREKDWRKVKPQRPVGKH